MRRKLLGAGAVLCAGLFYGYVLLPLGFWIPCPFRALTGLRCPGCGVSALCLELLHGRFVPGYNWGLVLAAPAIALLAGRRWWGCPRRRWEDVLTWVILGFLLAWGVARNIWQI